MRRPEVAHIREGARDQTTNLPTYNAYLPIDGPGDEERFGDIDAIQALGVSSIPFPETDEGYAEGVVLRGCGGSVGCVVGGRDERCASVYASLKPGDSCLHSTDPDAAAQFQAKATRQAVMLTTASDGSTMLNILDGKNDKVQIAAFGGIIQMTPDAITITGPGGASIIMQGDTVIVQGKLSSSAGAAQSLMLANQFAATFAAGVTTAVSSLGPAAPATTTQVAAAISALGLAVANGLSAYSTKVTSGQ